MVNLEKKEQISKDEMIDTMTSIHKSLVLILETQTFSNSVRDLIVMHITEIEERLAAEGIEL